MSREQIEEMAKATTKHCEIDNQCGCCHWSTCNECLAEVLYNTGYRKQSEGEWGFDGISWTCSECGEYATKGIQTNFCPNCGAKMKGGEG